MSGLTATQLARIQAAALPYLPDTAQVLRDQDAGVNNGEGGVRENYQPYGAPVPCLVSPWMGRRGGIEQPQNGRFEVTLTHKLLLPAGTDVGANDRIQVGTRLFDVNSVAEPTQEAARLCLCEERTA